MNVIGSILMPLVRYAEADESGALSDSFKDGVRTRTVTAVYHCFKSESKTVAKALPVFPSVLYTTGGRASDGSWAASVNWGAGFELVGIDCAEISPHLSRLAAQYKAEDPTGGDGVVPAGTPGGGIIGKPWEGGPRYIETPESGKCRDDRVYLADSFGWNRAWTVDVSMMCLKTDSRTVMDALSLAPTALTTNPYSGPSVAWGGGYSLVGITGSSASPSFYNIKATYRKNQAEAIFSPPDGIALACAAGVCSIKWKTVLFEDLDSVLPLIDDGLDVELDTTDTYLIHMTCNGVIFSSFTPSVTVGDKILKWVTTATSAQLKFCDELWKDYTIGA